MASQLIDNIETNDMNFKHLETTKDIVISPKNEYGDPQRPDPTHTWTAKVSDGENYVGDYAVKVNATSLIVDSEDFTKLPVGQYQLEVWEQWTDPDGTKQLSIYPSPSQTIHFQIYANIPDQAGKEIKEIGFQDVVDQAVMNIGMNYVFKVNTIDPDQTATVVQSVADGKNYVTFNIPRGKTGEQGFRGLAGKNFHIQQTFTSVKDMEASQGKGFEDGDFALIASDVNDPDNSKFYVWSDANKKFTYMDDLSGAQGIQGPVGPAPTLHVTKVTTVPNGEQPSFTATPVGNGNYNIEIGLPKGDKGDTGSHGYSFWAMKMTAGGNVSGRYITDLYNASASNLPEVNDLVVQPDGNVYQVTGVSGSTFNLGSALFSINGDQAEYQALEDKFNNMHIGGRNLVLNTDQDIVIDDSADTSTQGFLFGTIDLTQQLKVGDQITVSAEGELTGKGDLSGYNAVLYDTPANNQRSNSTTLIPGKRSSVTLMVSNLNGTGDTVLLIYAGKYGDTEGKKVVLHHLKVEFGNVPTDWSPAPEDMTTAIQSNTTAIGQANQQISTLQQQVSQLEQKINPSTQPASSASQSTQPVASSATKGA